MKKPAIIIILAILLTLLWGCGDSKSPAMSIPDVISRAEELNGKNITIEGIYAHGWEWTFLTESVTFVKTGDNKELLPVGQSIWFAGMIPLDVQNNFYRHSITESETQTYGKVRVTGLFETGGPYGYLKASKYRITAAIVETLDWTPPE